MVTWDSTYQKFGKSGAIPEDQGPKTTLIQTQKKLAAMGLTPKQATATWSVATQSTAVYFAEAQHAEQFVNEFEHNQVRIIGAWGPKSQAQIDLLKSDENVITRKSLFHGKYTWAIRFKFTDKDKSEVAKLSSWIQGMYGDDNGERHQFHIGLTHVRNWNAKPQTNATLYLVDEGDVIFAKLANSHLIRKVERVVLENNNNKEDNEPLTLPQTD